MFTSNFIKYCGKFLIVASENRKLHYWFHSTRESAKETFSRVSNYIRRYSITSGHFLNIFRYVACCVYMRPMQCDRKYLFMRLFFLNNRFRQTFLLLLDVSVPLATIVAELSRVWILIEKFFHVFHFDFDWKLECMDTRTNCEKAIMWIFVFRTLFYVTLEYSIIILNKYDRKLVNIWIEQHIITNIHCELNNQLMSTMRYFHFVQHRKFA